MSPPSTTNIRSTDRHDHGPAANGGGGGGGSKDASTEFDILSPELWDGGERPWPQGTGAQVLVLSDSYSHAVDILAARIVHVYAIPLPPDIVEYNRKQKADRAAAAAARAKKAANAGRPRNSEMDRDYIPQASYEAYVAASRACSQCACARAPTRRVKRCVCVFLLTKLRGLTLVAGTERPCDIATQTTAVACSATSTPCHSTSTTTLPSK